MYILEAVDYILIRKILLTIGIVISFSGLIMMVHSRNVSRYYDLKRDKSPFYAFSAFLTVLGVILQISGIWIVFFLKRVDFF